MSEPIRQTAIFIRDLLSYDEQLIRIGRDNFEIADFDTAYIGVDSIGSAQRISGGERFDGDAESMNYAQRWSAPIIVSFYGDGAHGRAQDFALRINTQAALELQEAQGISVFQSSQLTDVKVLTGQQYGERVELALNVHYSTGIDVDTLRIDEAQVAVLTEQGQETTT